MMTLPPRFLSLLLLPALSFAPGYVIGDEMYGGGIGQSPEEAELMDVTTKAMNEAARACGIDVSMLGMANQMTYSQQDPLAPLRKFAASVKNTCGGADEDRFRDALDDFESCSDIDLIDFIEFLPSAVVGIMEDCLEMFVEYEDSILKQYSSNTFLFEPDMTKIDIEVSQRCFNSFFGNNAFGNANLQSTLEPERTFRCLLSLSKSVPECTFHVWPIPIVGSIFRQATCLVGNMAPVLEGVASVELRKLDLCLPASFTDPKSCDEIRAECVKRGSALFLLTSMIKAFSGEPLSDAYVKAAQLNNLSSVLDKFDEFNKKCSGHNWEHMLEGTSDVSTSPRLFGGKSRSPPVSATASSTSSSSPSGSGFLPSFVGGLVTGLILVGAAWGYVTKRHQNNMSQPHVMYRNVGYAPAPSAMEMS